MTPVISRTRRSGQEHPPAAPESEPPAAPPGAMGEHRSSRPEGMGAATAADAQFGHWIEAIVGGDQRALAALYDATFARVFGLVQRIVRDTATAEEVVEDAYFQVWRQAVRFDPKRGKALTWVLAIARSRAIDALRRQVRFQHVELDDAAGAGVFDEAPESDELLDLALRTAELQHALTLLGEQPRQLVSMAFFRGLSHEQIAAHTRLPLGTVKSQIRRALLALRQILGGDGAVLVAP
ncbi:MAG: sigma-70 family RNA polymerase sigma factor [Proteobacteria bacterium]|nr:sigma-70 family RNA polymerase sigma factor [Pseudomonadota bacterium]MBS0464130.1 sigma-70 family RNA polymerase sigma factor [Pseudomonadota bacterium]